MYVGVTIVMVFVRAKKIKGKKHHYLEKSIRLANGKIKKISIYIKDYKPKMDLNSYESILNKRISEEIVRSATEKYQNDLIFTKSKLAKAKTFTGLSFLCLSSTLIIIKFKSSLPQIPSFFIDSP